MLKMFFIVSYTEYDTVDIRRQPAQKASPLSGYIVEGRYVELFSIYALPFE